ncbi:MAG: aconitase X, partial [Kiloniellales bacterium]|nr:aconitase X [Kiloniellales bacterium]
MALRGETLILSDRDRALLRGEEGEALQFAMEVVVRAAEVMGAPGLIDASFAHIDACHYFGQAHLDFARFFVERGARFEIP